MLQIKNICKRYITGDLIQTALDHVSLNLRDNEFVAILGPSGSGKTTLLNIIGGLDRYDEGDLIINNISTKKYKDRDWDSYRNHTIGFVFQSYNLIPHQTILANVELALTISGISKRERKERAIQALKEVGLGNQIHKKPTQMSGGQMQRVAIARALVNNPDILLADEPTGALDSDTSIQVMDLLQKVAKDRLVVMVTHNPELAHQYATRIVNLKDGKIIDDSNPFIVDEKSMPKLSNKNMGKASMSFLTSLGLSFNNLATKKARTFLTAFAGSIGIIGIALILSLSNGVELYIQKIEEDTLSEYPLQITTNAIDLSAMMESMGVTQDEEDGVDEQAEVVEVSTMSTMFSSSRNNDLKSLKDYIESDDCDINKYANAVEYTYSITPRIYAIDDDSYRQVNPSTIFSSLMGSSAISSAYSSYMSVFNQMAANEDLYKDQYDVMAGRWPENDQEMVVVLGSNHTVTDFTLYACGLKDSSELTNMMNEYISGKTVTTVSERGTYKYEDFIGIQFKLVNAADLYEYDKEYNVYVDKSSNAAYMNKTVRDGLDLEIVGVVMPKDDDSASMLTAGINYTAGLTKYIIEQAQDSDIVKDQLATPEINVFTGKEFTAEDENTLDFSNFLTVDTSALENMFSFDMPTDTNLDLSGISMDSLNLNLDTSSMDYSDLLSNIDIKINQDELGNALTELLSGYMTYASASSATDYSKLPSAMSSYLQSDEARGIVTEKLSSVFSNISIETPDFNSMFDELTTDFSTYIASNQLDDVSQITIYMNNYFQSESAQAIISKYTSSINEQLSNIQLDDDFASELTQALYDGYENYATENSLPQISQISTSLQDYLASKEGSELMASEISKIVNVDEIQSQLASSMTGMMSSYSTAMNSVMSALSSQVTNYMNNIMIKMAGSMNIDASALENMFSFNMDEEDMTDLLSSMMSEDNTASYASNLDSLNYADLDTPEAINIYPKNFENKSKILDILDEYNEDMENKGLDDRVITYTDYVGVLMNSVTDIIDTISYVLIAFVGISLVVSSIMIGIITYISVLERTKEIGILRAIGASKANVSQVFNAETFLIGLLSGVLGIVVSELLLIPANILIHTISGNYKVNAQLPILGAFALIGVAILLTLIGGWIPAKGAAKKDPVLALRSE